VIDQSQVKKAVTVLAALLLTACGGASAVAPGPSNAQQSATVQQVGASRPSYVPACPCLYVASEGSGPYGNGVITIYPVTANGNFSPGPNTIGGSNTGILYPRGVAVNSVTGNIFVANSNLSGDDRVTVYAAGSSGNVTPIQTISGSNTGLSDILGIAVGTAGDIFVSSSGGGSGSGHVSVFAAGANGNVAPSQSISGPLTGIDQPYGLAVDPPGNIYVVNNAGESVTVFSPGANGNVAPIRTISGSHTGFGDAPIGIAWGHGPPAAGRIYVTQGNDAVAVFHAGANGNATPVKTISGALTDLNQPWAVALGPGGGIFIANVGQNTNGTFDVTKYVSYPSLLPGNNNVAPVHTIVGSLTELWLPDGVAVH
jgi:hypothetical protein